MMKKMCKVWALLMAAAMLLSMSAAFADKVSTVEYLGHTAGFKFDGGAAKDGITWTGSDLFYGFKGVMPGDELTQEITITNNYSGCDYVDIYMYAMAHDAQENKMSDKVAAVETEGVDAMNEFLAQMNMTVQHGSQKIYGTAHPNNTEKLTKTGEGYGVNLGRYAYKGSTTLTVTLEVPLEMSNEFANRAGEVDWIFVAVEGNNSHDHNHPQPSPTPWLYIGPKTGDETSILPWAMGLGIAIAVLVVLLFAPKRRRHN